MKKSGQTPDNEKNLAEKLRQAEQALKTEKEKTESIHKEKMMKDWQNRQLIDELKNQLENAWSQLKEEREEHEKTKYSLERAIVLLQANKLPKQELYKELAL